MGFTDIGFPESLRGALTEVAEVVHGTNRGFSEQLKAVVSLVLDTVAEEKSRIRRGKRTAAQRKHGTTVSSFLFENLAVLQQHLDVTRNKQVMTRSLSKQLKRSREEIPPMMPIQVQNVATEFAPSDSPDEEPKTMKRQRKWRKPRKQCVGKTKLGHQCKLKAIGGGNYCARHGPRVQ